MEFINSRYYYRHCRPRGVTQWECVASDEDENKNERCLVRVELISINYELLTEFSNSP